ncbi:MAG: ribonuclease R [Geobacteraceae bacterium]|nr:ribonuclease R [Geobacteraceae bacterium]
MKFIKRTSRQGLKPVSGTLSVHRDGYGFVTPDVSGNDVFVPARYLRENLHGDRVEVEIQSGSRGGKKEGRIVKTLERAIKSVTGIFSMRRSGGFLKPTDERLPGFAVAGPFGKANDGEVVVAEIITYPKDRQPGVAKIVEILGAPDNPEVEVLSVVRKFDLPDTFSPLILKAAKAVPQLPSEADITGRHDLRGITTVTIDGETARDFDDAVSVSREGEKYRLRVSIADVSHYVLPGSPIDKEAYLRGTSVYFPDRCIPMLPEELSNGICSLNPHVDRLTLTAEMLFNKDGEMIASSFYPSVIKSAARLTYTLVSRIVELDEADAKKEYDLLLPDLAVMQELSTVLIKMRKERGSIDFDLPEAEIILDEFGSTEAIVRAERNQAHKLIESFMLAANEAVAGFLTENDIPLLYRIHELPDQDRLAALAEFLLPLGYDLPQGESSAKPADIQRLLAKAEGSPEERLVNRLLLRSMKQARYAEQNFGHFGLAAPVYTHFTSPIRRYPDLVVHRILKWYLMNKSADNRGKFKGGPFPGFPALLTDMGEHTSRRERVAIEAERDIIELKKVQFMVSKVGEEFEGFISGVSAFGFFVELDELFVEGLVHISTLPQDRYNFNETAHILAAEGSSATYKIGDPVRIIVAAASPERRQIEFTLAGVIAKAVKETQEYRKVPVKGKKPQGWMGGRKSDSSSNERSPGSGKPARRDGGGRKGRGKR